jgi:hypothetical protein
LSSSNRTSIDLVACCSKITSMHSTLQSFLHTFLASGNSQSKRNTHSHFCMKIIETCCCLIMSLMWYTIPLDITHMLFDSNAHS